MSGSPMTPAVRRNLGRDSKGGRQGHRRSGRSGHRGHLRRALRRSRAAGGRARVGEDPAVDDAGSGAGCVVWRVQFTPDLMPADILGTKVLHENRFEFHESDLRNLVLADEVNRATPKTQSALLEAMQEAHHPRWRDTQAPRPSWSWRRRTRSRWRAPTPPRGPARPFLFKSSCLSPAPATWLRYSAAPPPATTPPPTPRPTGPPCWRWEKWWQAPRRISPARVRRHARGGHLHGASWRRNGCAAMSGTVPAAAQALVLGGKARPDRRPAKSRRRRRGGIGTGGAAPPGPRLRGGGGWVTDDLIGDVVAAHPFPRPGLAILRKIHRCCSSHR